MSNVNFELHTNTSKNNFSKKIKTHTNKKLNLTSKNVYLYK